nr:hypothetical protein [Tanacetum cinerariifolium]
MPTVPYYTPTILQPSSYQPKNTKKPRKPKRKDTQVLQPSGPTESVTDEAVHKELDDRLVRDVTTASSLEAEKCFGEDASKQERRIDAIDADDKITLVNDADNEMFDVDDLGGKEVFDVEQEVVSTVATTATITTKEFTLAQALEALKTSKPKVKGIVFQDPGKLTTTTTTISSQHSQDKCKGIIIEEPVKPKKKEQVRLDEEVALKIQAEFDEVERLARKRAKIEQEAIFSLIETWDKIQAKIDDDHQLAERLQAQEQEQEELAFKRVNTFEDIRTELVKGKRKRAREELIQESIKKQNVEDNKEKVELKQLIKTIPDEEEVEINDIPLVVKSPRIVDWKIHKEGKKTY